MGGFRRRGGVVGRVRVVNGVAEEFREQLVRSDSQGGRELAGRVKAGAACATLDARNSLGAHAGTNAQFPLRQPSHSASSHQFKQHECQITRGLAALSTGKSTHDPFLCAVERVDYSTRMPSPVRFGLRHVLREHRKRLKLTQDKLADLAGTTGETISRIERGVVEASPETIRAVAPVLGVSAADLLALLDNAEASGEVVALDRDTRTGSKRDVIPVITEAQAGSGQLLYSDAASLRQYTEEFMERPAGLRDRNAFGVRITGESMKPVYRAGMVVAVSPASPLRPGDEVFVALNDGARLVKIAHPSHGAYILSSANYHEYGPRIVPIEDVDVIYPIVFSQRRASLES